MNPNPEDVFVEVRWSYLDVAEVDPARLAELRAALLDAVTLRGAEVIEHFLSANRSKNERERRR